MEPAEFKLAEDRAVNEAIELQEDVGLDVLTDGERMIGSDRRG
jgi:methionine synthase II (cobalamin-independent)